MEAAFLGILTGIFITWIIKYNQIKEPEYIHQRYYYNFKEAILFTVMVAFGFLFLTSITLLCWL